MSTTPQVKPRPWKFIALLLPLVVGALGCPHTFGRGGSVDRAVHKDTLQGARPPESYECPLLGEDVEDFCGEQANTQECLERCLQ
jgi:hypothetical protein